MSDDIFSLYGTDEQLEAEGVWFDCFRGGIKFRLRRAGGANVEYTKELAKQFQIFRRRYGASVEVPNDVAREAAVDIFIATVIAEHEDPEGVLRDYDLRDVLIKAPELFRQIEQLASDDTWYSAVMPEVLDGVEVAQGDVDDADEGK